MWKINIQTSTFPSYNDFFSLPSKAVAMENLLADSAPVAFAGTAIRCQAALYQDCPWTSQGSDNCVDCDATQ